MASKKTENAIIGVAAFLFVIGLLVQALERGGGTMSPAPPTVNNAATALNPPPALSMRDGSEVARPVPAIPAPQSIAPTAKANSGTGVRYQDTPDYVPPAAHPGMSRDEQIRALMRDDPSSYGYTDTDRAFLREHGVTEAQARALEEAIERGY